MQYLESDSSNLETYSVTNRKPVEISKNRRNVAKARFLGNDPSKCVLNKLQASQIRNRRASKERVTVIEPRTHYRISGISSSYYYIIQYHNQMYEKIKSARECVDVSDYFDAVSHSFYLQSVLFYFKA